MSHAANLILKAARECDQRIGPKVWISDVHAAYCRIDHSRITLDAFKTVLADLRCELSLVRCDMAHAYPAQIVADSEIEIRSGGAVLAAFHFVKLV